MSKKCCAYIEPVYYRKRTDYMAQEMDPKTTLQRDCFLPNDGKFMSKREFLFPAVKTFLLNLPF